ncbi:MAG: tetratricopeptide repeat protein [Thermoanaerobaculia bacterium]
MSGSIWVPGLLVLAVGLAGGLWAAFQLRRQGKASNATGDGDVRLKIADLENRKDELYQRLKRAEEEKADPGDRRELELAAARTLRELDKLRRRMPTQPPAKPAPTPLATPTTASLGTRHPLLVGFAFGAALVLLVTTLIYLALRDAKPDALPAAQAPAAQGTPSEPPHQATAPVPPELAQRIAELEGHLATSPEDIMARKEAAIIHLAAGQLVEAFEHAGVLLQQNPDDPDGLYVHGVVRLSMGQYAVSVDLLDRLLAQYPDHPDALMYRGLALHQLGQPDQAMDSWELGLEMAGGSHPQIEELIVMAEQGRLQAPATPQPAAATAPPSQTTPAPQTAADSYGMRLELGAPASPGATLFVFLRTGEAGPPVAAKRISQPTFPLDLTLGFADSMMGAELPESGILVARLDGDGDVSTTGPGDLQAQSAAEMGSTTRLVLGQ